MYDYKETVAFQHFLNLSAKLGYTRLDATDSLKAFGLTRFYEAIECGGLGSELNGAPALTLYAPTNKAFELLSAQDMQQLFGTPAACLETAKAHAVPGVVKMHGDLSEISYLDSKQFTYLPGTKITHRHCPFPIVVTSSKQPNAVALELFWIKTKNGVLHIIDAVLGSSDQRQYDMLKEPSERMNELVFRDFEPQDAILA